MSPEIAIASSFLPGEFHGHPADRIVVATARMNGFILLTRDKRILSYGKQNYVDRLAKNFLFRHKSQNSIFLKLKNKIS